MAIVKAEMVFNQTAGFSAEELVRIGTAAAGRTVSFPRDGRGGHSGPSGQRRWLIEDLIKEAREKTHEAEESQLWSALCVYARGETADKVAEQMGISRRQFFHWLKVVRREAQDYCIQRGRVVGLSWREMGRLLGISHEAARKAAGERSEDGGMRSEEAEREGTQTDTD